MVSSLSINSYTYSRAIAGTGKLYVPVQPSVVIYSQFDHVSGFAARPHQQGLSVSKVQILNSLIDQLASMKNSPKLDTKSAEMDSKQIDALIASYQQKIQTTVQVAQATGYGLAGAAPQVGALFSLDV